MCKIVVAVKHDLISVKIIVYIQTLGLNLIHVDTQN